MLEIKGKYGTAKVFTNIIEPECINQIKTLLNQSFIKDCKVRIMPDCHAGSGCVIGFTAEIKDKVIPNLVGVDIGCGVLTVPLGHVEINYKRFDKILRESIAYGRNINKKQRVKFDELEKMYCYNTVVKHQLDKVLCAIPSTGSGNHFVEIDEDNEGNKYLMIHCGSRHLGLDICKHYQNKAGKAEDKNNINTLINDLKASGRESEIQKAILEYKSKRDKIPNNLLYLIGKDRDEYLHDMRICQEYAALNRFTIAEELLKNYFNDCQVQLSTGGKLRIKQKGKYNIKTEWFDTIHNYIGDDNIIRKGAVAANEGQSLVIPINMRDGVLICKGKGNKDWNNSAPHGAGRIMSRSKAKETLELTDYANEMSGIFSTCINESTIDEAPMAYKRIEDIINNIGDTVDIINIIKPVYNFKAGD